jgi:DNA-binding response OmpR family regulator
MESPMHIMIIDDDTDDISVFMEALKTIDPTHVCESACNGEQALKMLRIPGCRIPDFLFLDLNMPKVNGKECLRELKKMSWVQDKPIAIYSTSKNWSDMVDTRELGANYFITKPQNFGTICNAISSVISRRANASVSSYSL